jgi:hypothetical protein
MHQDAVFIILREELRAIVDDRAGDPIALSLPVIRKGCIKSPLNLEVFKYGAKPNLCRPRDETLRQT